MKNTPFSILACVCLMLSAFLCGLFLGRNLGGREIQTEVLFGTPTETGSASTDTSEAPGVTGKININTADLAMLMTLEGIGQTYAQRIIDYRNEHGPFANIADITNVPGIGAKRFEAIMDQITVGD